MSASLPHRLIAIDATRKAQHFRLQRNLIGAWRIESMPGLALRGANENYILALDPSLPYQRHAGAEAKNIDEAKRQAPDLFPFPPEDTHYAASPRPEGGFTAYAMPKGDLAHFAQDLKQQPLGIIVAENNVAALTAALDTRLELGQSNDLQQPAVALRHPAQDRFLRLSLIFILILGGGLYISQWYGKSMYASTQKANQLLAQNLSVPISQAENLKFWQTMLAADQSAALGHPALQQKLRQVFKTLPGGVSIDRLDYANNQLTVSGLMSGGAQESVAGWAQSLAGPAPQITKLPKHDRYLFTLSIP
ncbi:MAG: hypothetical protein AB7U41_07745 [Dongiaceae bacterium]